MTANQQMIDYWNGSAGERWVLRQEEMDAVIRPFGLSAMDAGRPAPGERVLDIGCGCGDTTLELAARAPDGAVVGLDISGPMLARARERAAGRPRVSFVQADAATHPFEPGSFDLLFSRFGIMFFADPEAAFASLRRAGRRLAFVCWRTRAENPWHTVVGSAVADLLPPGPPVDPEAPGPFSFAREARIREVLGAAGWRDVSVAPVDHVVRYPTLTDVPTAVEFFVQIGPAASLVANLDDAGKARARAQLAAALAPHIKEGGPAFLGASWVVTARG